MAECPSCGATNILIDQDDDKCFLCSMQPRVDIDNLHKISYDSPERFTIIPKKEFYRCIEYTPKFQPHRNTTYRSPPETTHSICKNCGKQYWGMSYGPDRPRTWCKQCGDKRQAERYSTCREKQTLLRRAAGIGPRKTGPRDLSYQLDPDYIHDKLIQCGKIRP